LLPYTTLFRSLGLEQRLLSFRIEREIVGGRCGVDPLRYSELDAPARLVITLDAVRELVHELGIQQIGARVERRKRILLPTRVREARVQYRCSGSLRMREEIVPE